MNKYKKRTLWAFIIIVGIPAIVFIFNPPAAPPPARQPYITSQADQQGQKIQEATLPSDVTFSIIDSSTIPGIKRSINVRLNKEVSEITLRAIALKLKASDSRSYDNTFITYYLPGMAAGAGAWATTHFNPDLEVRILGLKSGDETRLVAQSNHANRDMIGRWLDEGLGSRITIFDEDGRLFIQQAFKDGSSFKKELVESRSPLGRRFDKVDGSSTGDYWILRSNGNLQIRDNDGLIATAKRIE